MRIFSRRDLADTYVEDLKAAWPYEDPETEVWVLDNEAVEYGRIYEAHWWESNDHERFTETFGDIPPGGVSVTMSEPGPRGWIKVISTDEERARKVLGERRAKYLAEQAGIA